MQGWRSWEREPPDPRGIDIRSKDALTRWKLDKWSSAITFYEPYNMAHSVRIGAATSGTTRIISATEAERLLGFPTDWTNIPTAIDSRECENKRKNAVGNASDVPVIARSLAALCSALKAPITTAMHLWEDQSLPAPFSPDVIDDLFGKALVIANDFQDLVQEFDDVNSD